VTDSWCIYARPRSITSFIQDIERFQTYFEDNAPIELPAPAHRLVSELSDKKPVLLNAGISSEGGEASEELSDEMKVFFPKPYNDAQLRLSSVWKSVMVLWFRGRREPVKHILSPILFVIISLPDAAFW